MAHFIDEGKKCLLSLLCLTVSGGHTQICLLKATLIWKLGETLDDAAGEAFDKSAKILGT